MGLSAEGINREIANTIEWANHCKYTQGKSLAIPETVVYKLATLLPVNESALGGGNLLGSTKEEAPGRERVGPSWRNIASGILPSLRYLVDREITYGTIDPKKSTGKRGLQKKVCTALIPDSHQDNRGENSAVNAYDQSNYYCERCACELSNLYFSCDGCSLLLDETFNLCPDCYNSEEYKHDVPMRWVETDDYPKKTDLHHVTPGGLVDVRGKPKEQDNNNVRLCYKCNRKVENECRCHEMFSKKLRFYTVDRLREMVAHVEKWIKGKGVLFATETEERLNERVMVIGDRSEALPQLYYSI